MFNKDTFKHNGISNIYIYIFIPSNEQTAIHWIMLTHPVQCSVLIHWQWTVKHYHPEYNKAFNRHHNSICTHKYNAVMTVFTQWRLTTTWLIYIYIFLYMYIYMVTVLPQSTNYPYNLNPYQIYSYSMSCSYNSIPAFFSQVQLTTEASICLSPSLPDITTMLWC